MYELRKMTVLLLFLITAFSLSAQKELTVAVDRPMAVAGKFYPADPDELRATLKKLFTQAAKKTENDVQAVIVPHAGYDFSGKIAASSYNQIDPDAEYDNIFIIGSSHSQSFNGASVYSAGDYLTPLGKVHVNRDIASKLISGSSYFSFIPEADENEHSIEIQVPFLQYHMKKPFNLVPIIIGTQSEETCKQLARALMPYFNKKNLFIISSDFSHYPSSVNAKTTDKQTADAILKNSPAAFMESIHLIEKKKVPDLATTACGWTSILTLLYMTSPDPAIHYKTISYMNSGEITGADRNNTVGYWSIAVTRGSGTTDQGWLKLTDQEKQELLKLSRTTLEQYFASGKMNDSGTAENSDLLNKKYGAFVTLREKGQLRGCIGMITSDIPLRSLVQKMSVAAAVEDPRFKPVTADELKNIKIEISVLSPLKKVKSPDEVDVSKHGVLIKKGDQQGTLLPQVAKENNWNREQLLGNCSMEKAGLGWDGWKTAEIYVYEAVYFSEEEFTANKN